MKALPVTLALDQGTHASRAALVGDDGILLYQQFEPVSLVRSDSRHVEQDPVEILGSLQRVASGAIEAAAQAGFRIRCAGLATQRSSLLAWRRDNGEPLSRVLSWQDTRGHRMVESLYERESDVRRLTGLPLSAHYGASKMRWLLDCHPGVARAASEGTLCLGTLSAFVLHHLLENRPLKVDAGNAARTLLMDVRSQRWSNHLTAMFGIRREWLPEIVPVRHRYGRVDGTGIELLASHGDQPAALLGCGEPLPHSAVVNLGTGAFVMVRTGERPVDHPRLLTGILDSEPGGVDFCLEGTVNGAGSALDWVARRYGVPPREHPGWTRVTNPPLFVNTVGGLGSPWWRHGPAPRFVPEPGPDESAGDRRVAAVMESIVFLVLANLESMQETGASIERIIVGGGLSREDGLCQRLADTAGLEVRRVSRTEMTVLGTTRLAAGIPVGNPVDRAFLPGAAGATKRRYRQFLSLLGKADDRP